MKISSQSAKIVLINVLLWQTPQASAHEIQPTQIETESTTSWILRSMGVENLYAAAMITISNDGHHRHIRADSLPSHATGSFPNASNPNRMRAQDYRFIIPLRPVKNATRIKLDSPASKDGPMMFGVALNGVPFDPTTAEFWNNNRIEKWNTEVTAPHVNFGLDKNNAHVQPGGGYHYHGIPNGLMKLYPYKLSPILLGYAADGFPIYGPYGHRDPLDLNSKLVSLKSGYQLKSGDRKDGPGGPYDGSFASDYFYQEENADLDRCNGRFSFTTEYPQGIYHYVLTKEFPHIPRCFYGNPDPSFKHRNAIGKEMRRGEPGGNRPLLRPDLRMAASKLGVSQHRLRSALGPPPPNFKAAASKFGISASELEQALRDSITE